MIIGVFALQSLPGRLSYRSLVFVLSRKSALLAGANRTAQMVGKQMLISALLTTRFYSSHRFLKLESPGSEEFSLPSFKYLNLHPQISHP